jgi:hypothetical protein
VFYLNPVFPYPDYEPAPITFDVTENGDIIISVPRVAEAFGQKAEWEGHKIHYRIGRIDYAKPEGGELNDLSCRREPQPPSKLSPDEHDFSLDCTPPPQP